MSLSPGTKETAQDVAKARLEQFTSWEHSMAQAEVLSLITRQVSEVEDHDEDTTTAMARIAGYLAAWQGWSR
jgi:hypothetical protein